MVPTAATATVLRHQKTDRTQSQYRTFHKHAHRIVLTLLQA
jgi:hypothetical protein